jgi:uncharacterized membrane protein YeaQ/YmgE (transglycosylase-associated protein family)
MSWLSVGLSFIPGVGPVAGVLGSVISTVGSCTVCMVALGIGGAWVAGDIHGHHKAEAVCQAADVSAQLAATRRDAAIAAMSAASEKKRADDLAAANSGLDKQVADFELERKKLPAVNGCLLRQSDLQRLQGIQ